MVSIEHHHPDQSVERVLVGICNKAAQGGGLSRQVDEVVKRAGEHRPVIVRSTQFPSSPKAAVVQQLDSVVAGGGRRVAVEDSDWRAMMALAVFRERFPGDPTSDIWLKQSRPLTGLASLRVILALDSPGGARARAIRTVPATSLPKVV
jgi:hypothetical protein